jgi:PAS domain S-box-containing protein
VSNARILIVEDEAVTGMDIRRSLTEMGYSVCAIAMTGEQAVRKAGEMHPDLILMDIMLAGKMNGVEAAGIIQREFRIPVVYLTAYSDDSILTKAKVTEPFGYILKPFREMELRTTIEMALYKHAMEHAIRISEEITRVLLDATDDLLFLIDTNGMFLAVNKAFAHFAGKEVGEFSGTNISDLVRKETLSSRMAAWNVNPTIKTPSHFEDEFRGRWFKTSVYPITNQEGEVILYAISITDVTRNKRSAELSRQNEEFFRSYLEETSDIIAILNSDGTIRNESPSITRALGYSSEVLVGRPIFDLVAGEEVPALKRILAESAGSPGIVRQVSMNMRSTDGSVRPLHGILSNLYGNPVIDGMILNGWLKTGPGGTTRPPDGP